jgi:hypothetical protein
MPVSEKPIKVGVIGVGRGADFARSAAAQLGIELVAMSSVGILAWKSALADGAPFDMPDFKDEASRTRFENDHWSPWPEHAAPGQPPPSILGMNDPAPEDVARARKIWQEMGYEGE